MPVVGTGRGDRAACGGEGKLVWCWAAFQRWVLAGEHLRSLTRIATERHAPGLHPLRKGQGLFAKACKPLCARLPTSKRIGDEIQKLKLIGGPSQNFAPQFRE